MGSSVVFFEISIAFLFDSAGLLRGVERNKKVRRRRAPTHRYTAAETIIVQSTRLRPGAQRP